MSRSPFPARLLIQLAMRQMSSRLGRALLTVLSVVIGVAGVVAVITATGATHGAYRDMYAAIAGRAALEVVSERGGALEQSLIEKIRAIEGVRAAAPLVQRATSLYFGDSRVDAMILGVDPASDKLLHDFDIKAGAYLDTEDGAVLDASFAHSGNIKLGDQIKVFTPSGMRRLKVVGLVSPRSVAEARMGGTIWVRLEKAQEMFRLGGQVDSLQLVLAADADEKTVEHRVSQLLPPGVVVRPPDANSRLVRDRMLSAQVGLNVGCAYTLLAAAFIILNTFVMNVTERRRQLGILRAVGATRSQIMRMLISEGLLLGSIGTLIGLVVGLAGAWALIRAMEALFRAPLPELSVPGIALVLGVVSGLAISLFATYFPARRAAHVSPVEAMRRGPPDASGKKSYTLEYMGVPLALAGLLGMFASLAGWIRASLMMPAGLALLIALVLLMPSVLRPLVRLVAAGLIRLIGVEGRIAQGQLLRWRVRTALTVGVVFVALSTGIGMGNSILSNIGDVRKWYHQTLSADFFVRASHSNMVTGTAADMPEELGSQIAAIPGVKLVDYVSFVRSTVNDMPVLVVARKFNEYPELPLDIKEGTPEQLVQGFRHGEAVLGAVLAQRLNLHPGDTIELSTEQGPHKLRVAGVVTDYQVGGMMLYMQRSQASQLLKLNGVDVFLVRVQDGARDNVAQALKQLSTAQGLILQSFSDVASYVDNIMSGVQAGLWAILALQFLVAGFGIANTLTMNVLEQTREIGMLRVVAMTRWQVRKMIFAQAGLIGLVAVILGLPGGLLVGWIFNLCTKPLTGQPIEFELYHWLFVGGPLMVLAIIAAAAWLPAERAVRLEPSEALAYE